MSWCRKYVYVFCVEMEDKKFNATIKANKEISTTEELKAAIKEIADLQSCDVGDLVLINYILVGKE